MSAVRLYKAQELCRQASSIPADQRAAFLDKACRSDQALREEVEFFLRMAVGAADLHETHAADSASPSITGSIQNRRPGGALGVGDVAFETPDHVGPYRLLEQVGVGGFGMVYLAEQEKPVRRKVALKIIKLGMDTREVINRFEAERQALAMMDHPNVAKVFDGGATATGRPYFVMEYVAGEPITAYCDKHKLSVDERLELFITVCEAVQHAHTKGIIHRDIKPSNILAKPYVDSGVSAISASPARASVKVIDFGVAKAINQRLSDNTVHTHQGQIIGTPAYMSPEQAEMGGTDVDTRTDIYSLGVLLYELLIGSLPFDPNTLLAGGYGEVQRIIREVDPPKPSTRLSSLRSKSHINEPAIEIVRGSNKTSGEIAGQRRTDERSLLRQVRGDLDWIVMRCLEKDRTRRYETASAVAMEVRRFLKHEPVLAGPPSVAYRLRKFVRRNRVGALAACSIVLLSVALVIATRSMHKAKRKEQEALALRIDGYVQQGIRHREKNEWDGAEKMFRAALTEDTNCYRALVNLVAVQRFKYEDSMPKLVLDECIMLLDRAVAVDPARAETWNARGVFLRMSGKLDEAVQSHLKGIQINPDFYASYVSLACVHALRQQWADAERELRKACSLEGAATTTMPFHNLAAVLHQRGKFDDALATLDRARAINPSDIPTILLQARVHLARSTNDDTKQALRAAITADGLDSGPKRNSHIVRVLALAELAIGDWTEASEAAKRALEAADSPMWPRAILAITSAKMGDLVEARVHLMAARKAQSAVEGPVLVRIEQGLLWIDSATELESLLTQADSMIGAAAP